MKRFFQLGTCVLTIFGLVASSHILAQTNPPATEMTLPSNVAPMQPPSAPLEGMEMHKAVVGVRIDPLTDELVKAGLTAEGIKQMVVQQLEDSGIQVDDSLSQPILQLRLRSIAAGFDVATFFQLSLQEESMLVRNRSVFNAITWSQASMLCCRPEDLKKETEATIVLMLQTFSKEYLKSLRAS